MLPRLAGRSSRRELLVSERERAIGLYAFLREFAQLRTQPARSIDSYDSVIWAADIPREPGCDCIAWHRPSGDTADGEDGDTDDPGRTPDAWIEIERPPLGRPPEPPEAVHEWARSEQIGDSSLDLPELRATIPAEFEDDPPLRLEDHPDVQAAWDEWIEARWWPWAEQDRRDEAVRRVYADLFAMRQRQQGLGEAFEVVFGLGFLSWAPTGGPTVRRHLVAARAEIDFDAESGTLTVAPAADGAEPKLEQEMLDPEQRPDPDMVGTLEATLGEIGDSLWSGGPIDGLLKAWVNSAADRGEYDDSLDRPDGAGTAPVVHFAPALILRRRTEHVFVSAFEEIGKRLDEGAVVPEGVARFITPPSDSAPAADGVERDPSATPPGELYFPLAANNEQRQISARLATNRGVLVQGPPGTGKSHTIVNLISHALATGQRVLVTSHAARALEVLRDKIRDDAPEIAPLAVVLTGNSRAAITEMEASVQGILDRQASWSPRESDATIERLQEELDRARREEARVLAELRAIREEETYTHDDRYGYGGTLARIAETLNGQRETLGWIPDDIAEDVALPLGGEEFTELTALLRDADVTRWGEHGWAPVELDGLPAAEDFGQAVAAESVACTAYDDAESIRQRPEYAALGELDADHRRNLASGLNELARALERIERHPWTWTGGAAAEIVGGAERAWRQLHDDTRVAAEAMRESAEWLDAHPISPEPSDPASLLADAGDLLEHLNADKGWGFWIFRAGVVKRAIHIRELRIGGARCETAEAVRDLVRRLRADLDLRHLRERWARHHGLASTSFSDLAAELEDLCTPLSGALDALAVRQRLAWFTAFAPDAPEPIWTDRSALLRLRETLDAVDAAERYEEANERIDAWLGDLARQRRLGIDPALADLYDAVIQRGPDAYEAALQRSLGNREIAARLCRRQHLCGKLEGDAPGLAAGLAETSGDAVWNKRAADFERAWNWRRAHAWVLRMASPDEERALREDLDRAKRELAGALQRLAAEEAWRHCQARMTDFRRASLEAWQDAMLKVGTGRGKFAAQHRRNARHHLNNSRSAIPAWVMPLHRVAETIQSGDEPLFDIAVIDEASQSGPEALLLAWLAKQIVVVGDDEQISPADVGVRVSDVNRLREQYLADIPFNDAFGAQGGSFFELARRFLGNRIRLREHFRCMPEIIQFSNNLSYASQPLIPLRQYGADRLEPVVTRHVRDGYQRGTAGRAVNPPEAEAIAAEIVRMCDDPAYEGKTIGVISLLGETQARDIERRLVHAIGPQEMERRRIVCGDAYAFQGDERDVMLLSLVSAPSEERPTVRALTDRASKQRFNVAVSRARDQMVLFHTPTLNELSANPDCVRRKLLEYCLDPKVAMPDVGGLDMPELERIAHQTQRRIGNQPPPFESWFELDVFLRIVRRGYRVIPQFEIHGYHIDLVVQGMAGALAVECDGDRWHGADRYEADAARQRDLERAGWTFWRVRESAFRLDPDAALDDLWATLERLGILPSARD